MYMNYYSQSLPDRIGSQIHDNLSAYAFCYKFKHCYFGSISKNSCDAHQHQRLCTLLGIPFIINDTSLNNLEFLKKENYKHLTHDGGNPNQVFTEDFRKMLSSNLRFERLKFNQFTVVVHIRRGDILHMESRFLPNEHYLKILKKIRSVKADSKIIICSEYNFQDDTEEFSQLNCVFAINTNLEDTWKLMISADIFIMSKSSFSYVPAVFNNNKVIYTEMWHKKLDNWISHNDPNLIKLLKL